MRRENLYPDIWEAKAFVWQIEDEDEGGKLHPDIISDMWEAKACFLHIEE